MARNLVLASLLALGLAGGASAQGAAGYDVTAHVPRQVGHVVGGGSATIVGGGDNMQVLHSPGGAGGGGGGGTAQSGRLARLVNGSGDGPQVEYLDPAPAPAGWGREAWLIGGGDDARLVYAPPRRPR